MFHNYCTHTITPACRPNSISNERALNIYIVYHLNNTSHNFHPKLKNGLFGSVNITKRHSGFNGQGLRGNRLCFYTDYVFTYPSQGFAYNAIIFGTDSPENDNMLAIGKGNVKLTIKQLMYLHLMVKQPLPKLKTE